MFLLVDNYDSFTYNLYHYLLEIGTKVDVIRNDTSSVGTIANRGYKGIIISPGPCSPTEAGICLDLITALHQTTPILGVCLGHQAIGQAFGAHVVRGEKPMHAKISIIHHDQKSPLFREIPESFNATRYHSLIIEKSSLPDCLAVHASSEDGVIQAVSHQLYPTFGVQFHPESITSEYGHLLLKNFVTIAEEKR